MMKNPLLCMTAAVSLAALPSLGALVFTLASWALMNPGISIRFGNSGNSQRPAASWGNGEHFTYFPRISNNQGAWSLGPLPMLIRVGFRRNVDQSHVRFFARADLAAVLINVGSPPKTQVTDAIAK